MKLLSLSPHYKNAPIEGIRRIINEVTKTPYFIDKNQKIPSNCINWIRMGTTVATNALLERKGAKVAFLVTKGFKDLLVIGNQSRNKIFDLNIVKPGLLYQKVVEIDERVMIKKIYDNDNKVIKEKLEIVKNIDL